MKKFFIVIFIPFFTLVLIAYFLTATTAGLNTALFLGKNLFHIKIDIKKLDGSLINYIKADEVIYKNDYIYIKLQQLTIKYDWLRFVQNFDFFQIKEIVIDDIEIKYKTENKTKKTVKIKDNFHPNFKINLPIEISLNKLFIKHTKIYVDEQDKQKIYKIANLFLKGKINNQGLFINKLTGNIISLLNTALDIKIRGILQNSQESLSFDFDINAKTKAIKRDFNNFELLLKIKGDLSDLLVTANLTGSYNAILNANLTNIVKNPAWNLTLYIGSAKKRNYFFSKGAYKKGEAYGQFELFLGEIAKIYKKAEGELFAKGKFRLKRFLPDLQVIIDSKRLKYEDYLFKDVKITGNYFGKDDRADIAFNANLINLKGASFQKLNFNLKADSIYKKKGSFLGNLTDVKFVIKGYGEFRQKGAANFYFSNKKIFIKDFTLLSGQYGSLLNLAFIYEEFLKRFDLRLIDVPLILFSNLDANLKLKGFADLFINYAAPEGISKEIGKIKFVSKDGFFEINNDKFTFSSPFFLRFEGNLKDKEFTGNFLGKVGTQAGLTGDVVIAPFSLKSPITGKERLLSQIKVKIEDLKNANAFLKDLVIHNGSFNTNITFFGSIFNIKPKGEAFVSNFDIEHPESGARLKSKRFLLNFKENNFSIKGDLISKTGTIDISGSGTLKRDNLIKMALFIRGDEYELIDTSEISVKISPDLKVDIDTLKTHLSGVLKIPYCKVRQFKTSTKVIEPSKDIVIVDKKNPEKPSSYVPLTADIKVELGDSVSIDAYGLKADLAGSLKIKKRPERVPIASGVLFIKKGVYNMLETELIIKKGRLLYSLSPIDNPAVDIVAIKEVSSDITVGLEVSGTLKKPVMRLFSKPYLPQTEIMAYLLGKPKNKSGFSSSSLIAAGSNLFLEKVREKLGFFNEMKVDTGEEKDDLALVLGTYLRPDLYVKFINDFGDKVSKIILRYELSKHIELETETGESPSIDIFYKIER